MGRASEVLIACGSYFVIQGNNYGYALMTLGVFSAIVRFGVELTRTKIKDDIFSSIHEILKGMTVITRRLNSGQLHAKTEPTVH